jgi:hypothetical protein
LAGHLKKDAILAAMLVTGSVAAALSSVSKKLPIIGRKAVGKSGGAIS